MSKGELDRHVLQTFALDTDKNEVQFVDNTIPPRETVDVPHMLVTMHMPKHICVKPGPNP